MNQADPSPSHWGTQQQRPRPRPRPRRSTTMATACDQCHRCKVRCSGGRPSCERCQGYGSNCTYSLGKPLGKPPKNGRRKPNSPPPPPPALESDLVLATTNDEEASIHITERDGVGNGEPHFESLMQPEHDFGGTSPLAPSNENLEQDLSHDNSRTLFSGSENNLDFFNGTENAEEINLDFLITEFCADSWTNTRSKENVAATPLHLEVAMQNSDRVDSPLISPPRSLPSLNSTNINNQTSDRQTQIRICPSIENTISTPAAATTANGKNGNRNETHQHLPMLLEVTLRLYFKTPSIPQSPISETLRVARQGLQAVQQCILRFMVPLPAPTPTEPSSLQPGTGNAESESSSILACILLMDKVLLCYESLLKRRSKPGSSVDVSSPAAPSPNSTSNPTTSSSSIHQHMQPIFIGDFEVQGHVTWKVILDAVVRAEKQEARNTVSKLEEWANELVGRGKNEGHLAMTFLEPLKQRFHD